MTGRRALVMLVALGAAASSVRCVSTSDLTTPEPPDAAPIADAGSSDADAADALFGSGDPGVETFVAAQGVISMIVGGDTLYWSNFAPKTIRSCPVAGCVTPVDITSTPKTATLAFSTRLLWIDQFDAELFFLDDTGTVKSIGTTVPPNALAADESLVLLSTDNGQLVKPQQDPPTSTTTFLGFESKPQKIAVRDGFAWLEAVTGVVRFCDGASPCDATTSRVPDDGAIALALDMGQIFWSKADGRIRAASRSSASTGAPIDLATDLGEIGALAPDPTGPNLYFTVHGTAAASFLDGVVGRVAKGGGPVTILAHSQGRPDPIVIADNHVYWGNTYGGLIQRVPK